MHYPRAAPTLSPILTDLQDNQTVNLNWDHVIGGTYYKVYKDVNPITSVSEMTPICTTSDNQCQDQTILNGTYYYIVVTRSSYAHSRIADNNVIIDIN